MLASNWLNFFTSKMLKGSVAFLLASLYLLMPSLAFAGTIAFPIDVPNTDISKFVLNQLFPTLVDGAAVDTLSNVVGAFNVAVLAVGGILATYTLVIGTVSTAHDGEMLGKKFSSVWVPLRTVFGTAMVIPVVNGYCLMQFIVMWLVLQGVGLANMTWQAYIGNAFNNAASYQVLPKMSYDLELAQNTLRALTCVKVNEKFSSSGLFSSAGTTSNVALSGANWGWSAIAPAGTSCGAGGCLKNIYQFGDKGTSTEANTECGRVVIPAVSKDGDIAQLLSAKPNIITGSATAPSGTTSSNNPITTINQAKLTSYDTMIADLTPIAENIATWAIAPTQVYIAGSATYAQTAGTAVKTAADKYRASVLSATGAVLEDSYIKSSVADAQPTAVNSGVFAGVIESANNDGWMLAGAWYMRLVSYNSKVMSVANDRPTYKISGTTWSIEGDEVLNKALKETASIIGQSNMLTQDSAGGYISNNTSSDSSPDATNWFADMLGSAMTGIDLSTIKMENRHPVMMVIEMGNNLISSGLLIMGIVLGAGAIGGAVGGFLSKIPGVGSAVGGAIDSVSGAINNYTIAILVPLMIMGFVLAYFIPFLPFLIWLGAVIGWLILVVEAIFAAPLWAVMHLSPNGDDMLGSGKSGYQMVLGLIIRPALLIMGLAAAFILVQVIGQIVNSVFLDVFMISQGTSKTLGFVSTLMAYVIYTITMVSLVKKIFDVIHVIPDQLLRWIGGGGGQLGEYAKVMGGEGQSQLGQALGTSIGQARLLTGLGGGGGKAIGMGLGDHIANKRGAGAEGGAGSAKLNGAGIANATADFGKGAAPLINRTTGDEDKRQDLKQTMSHGSAAAQGITSNPDGFLSRVNGLAEEKSRNGKDVVGAYNEAFGQEWAAESGVGASAAPALSSLFSSGALNHQGSNAIDVSKVNQASSALSSANTTFSGGDKQSMMGAYAAHMGNQMSNNGQTMSAQNFQSAFSMVSDVNKSDSHRAAAAVEHISAANTTFTSPSGMNQYASHVNAQVASGGAVSSPDDFKRDHNLV